MKLNLTATILALTLFINTGCSNTDDSMKSDNQYSASVLTDCSSTPDEITDEEAMKLIDFSRPLHGLTQSEQSRVKLYRQRLILLVTKTNDVTCSSLKPVASTIRPEEVGAFETFAFETRAEPEVRFEAIIYTSRESATLADAHVNIQQLIASSDNTYLETKTYSVGGALFITESKTSGDEADKVTQFYGAYLQGQE